MAFFVALTTEFCFSDPQLLEYLRQYDGQAAG